MTYPTPEADESRRYRGKVSMPAKSRDLDLADLPLERRLSVVSRRAAGHWANLCAQNTARQGPLRSDSPSAVGIVRQSRLAMYKLPRSHM